MLLIGPPGTGKTLLAKVKSHSFHDLSFLHLAVCLVSCFCCMMDHDCIFVMTSVQAIAGEAGVPFFYRAGSEFEEM